MIDLYTGTTPNDRKISIMLEEVWLPYRAHRIDISKGDQFSPEFIAINPDSKIPAIVDPDGPGDRKLAVFESNERRHRIAQGNGAQGNGAQGMAPREWRPGNGAQGMAPREWRVDTAIPDL